MADSRADFLKVYSNLPISTRKEIIAVIEGKPISWDVAYIEVSENTPMGKEIIRKLVNMKILGCE